MTPEIAIRLITAYCAIVATGPKCMHMLVCTFVVHKQQVWFSYKEALIILDEIQFVCKSKKVDRAITTYQKWGVKLILVPKVG